MTTEGKLQKTSEHLDPFGGNSQVLKWGNDINLHQFHVELTAAVPGAQLVAYQGVRNIQEVLAAGAEHVWHDVSPETPVTLYLSPSSIDVARVKSLLAAHRPDPYFGMTPQMKMAAQVREKVASGQTLTPEELTLTLQSLLGT